MTGLRHLDAAAARDAARRAAICLAEDPRVQLVYLFGSAADSAQDTVRDVDIAIQSEPPLSFDELLRLRADAVAAAGAPLDLISLNEASVVLAHEVADSGECLYARTSDAEVDFVTRARARYWDFRPLLDAQWELAGERMKERRRGAPT